MIKYLGKKYKDINELAQKLDVRPSMAVHLFHANKGTNEEEKDLKIDQNLFKEDKAEVDTKEYKIQGKESK